jgi:hypothetical protein
VNADRVTAMVSDLQQGVSEAFLLLLIIGLCTAVGFVASVWLVSSKIGTAQTAILAACERPVGNVE